VVLIVGKSKPNHLGAQDTLQVTRPYTSTTALHIPFATIAIRLNCRFLFAARKFANWWFIVDALGVRLRVKGLTPDHYSHITAPLTIISSLTFTRYCYYQYFMVYGIKTGGRTEGRILPNSRATVLHEGGQCRWARGRRGWLIRAQKRRSKRISCKHQ